MCSGINNNTVIIIITAAVVYVKCVLRHSGSGLSLALMDDTTWA